MDSPVIELKNTSFSAQDKTVVQDISLAFEEGRTVALVGPSGGGKSTVLKLAAGLIVPTEGEVFFRDREISSMNRAQPANGVNVFIGFVYGFRLAPICATEGKAACCAVRFITRMLTVTCSKKQTGNLMSRTITHFKSEPRRRHRGAQRQ